MRKISLIIMTFISILANGQNIAVDKIWLKPISPNAGKWVSSATSFGADSTTFKTNYSYKVDTTAQNKMLRKEIAVATTGLVDYRGTYNASSGVFPSTGGSGTAGAILKGDYWSISVEGTIGGVLYTVGSSLLAMVDNPGQTATNWDKQVVSAPLAVRTFGDINSGVPAYSGTTLVDGQFFGSNLTPTGTKYGGYNGYFSTTQFSSSSSGLTILNQSNQNSARAIFQTGPSASGGNMILYDRNNSYRTLIAPSVTATSTPYIFDTEISHTSGNLLEGKNFGTVKYSIDYNGRLSLNDGLTILKTTSVGNAIQVTVNNATGGIGYYCSMLQASSGYYNTTSSTSTGIINDNYVQGNNTVTRIDLAGSSLHNNKVYLLQKNGSDVYYLDSIGDIHHTPPHASSWFSDSSRVISLTQNTWTGITNSWKNLYPSSGTEFYFNKITKTGDSCKITKAGRYEVVYEINASGTANATYEYRLCKRSGSTITYSNKQTLTGTGSVIVRIVSGSLPLIANDVVWAEVRTTTTGNNSITVIGGQIRVKTIKLDL